MVYNIFNIIDALCYRTNINDVDTRVVSSRDSMVLYLKRALPYGMVILYWWSVNIDYISIVETAKNGDHPSMNSSPLLSGKDP